MFTAKRTSSERCKKLLYCRAVPYSVDDVSENTLRIVQDGMETQTAYPRPPLPALQGFITTMNSLTVKMVQIRKARFGLGIRRASRRERQHLCCRRIVQHVGSGPGLQYVARRYRYSKANDTTEPPHRIPQHFMMRTGHDLIDGGRRGPQ